MMGRRCRPPLPSILGSWRYRETTAGRPLHLMQDSRRATAAMDVARHAVTPRTPRWSIASRPHRQVSSSACQPARWASRMVRGGPFGMRTERERTCRRGQHRRRAAVAGEYCGKPAAVLPSMPRGREGRQRLPRCQSLRQQSPAPAPIGLQIGPARAVALAVRPRRIAVPRLRPTAREGLTAAGPCDGRGLLPAGGRGVDT